MPQKVSIIIPIFNRELVIYETLNSVLDQTYINWECIIIDDGSTDNSIGIIKNYLDKDNRFRLFKRTADKLKGSASCRNIGIEKADGIFVIFLDSDDILDKNCLQVRIDTVNNHPNFDIWVFNMAFLDGKNAGKICNYYPTDIDNQIEYLKMTLRYQIPFSVTCPLWRIEILKKINGFDEQFARLEDPDIHCRALAQNFRFKFDVASKPDCFYRVSLNYSDRNQDINFKNIFINSFYQFIEKYASFKSYTIDNDDIRMQLRILLLRIYKDYILNDENYFNQFKFFYKLGKDKNLLSFKELLLILILKKYIDLRLDKVARLGYFRIRKMVFSKINKTDY